MDMRLSVKAFLISFSTLLIICFMYTAFSYGSEYQQQSVSAYTIIFETTGAVTVSATSSEPLCEKIVSKITLQEASSGSSFYSDSSQSTKTKTAKGGTIRHNTNFSLEKSKDYRIKVTLTDYFDGESVSRTYYKYL